MSVRCRDIMWLMEDLAPSKYAEEWDNPGLNIGDADAEVRKILVALDASEEVIDEAVKKGADMIVTHHPLLFHPVKKINYDSPDGRKIIKLIRNNINMFAAHTNLDAVWGGTNDVLSEMIGLRDLKVLASGKYEGVGIGRIGVFEGDITLGTLSVKIKEALGLDAVRVTGNLSSKVKKAALCTGAGMEFMKEALEEGCDVLITSDMRYHEAMEAVERHIAVIDATHYATENIIVPKLAAYLREKLENRGVRDVEILESQVNGQPFVHI